MSAECDPCIGCALVCFWHVKVDVFDTLSGKVSIAIRFSDKTFSSMFTLHFEKYGGNF